MALKQLSCQSSIEPCVLEEENTDPDDKGNQTIIESTVVTIESDPRQQTNTRPDSLILNTTTISGSSAVADSKKFLHRSQSTKSFKKPKLKPAKVLSNDLDQIYVISSNSCIRSDINDFYDSIDVIHERRSKNFSKFSEAESAQDITTTKQTNVLETTVTSTNEIR